MGGAREDGIKTCYAKNQQAWRRWLTKHHASESSVWLIIYHKNSGTPSITYDEAVDEALCFGWIDSKPNKRDHESYFQFFAKRKPKSKWSGINKKKVEKLFAAGRIHPAGQAMIDLAKETGTWQALDQVENLEIPADLKKALKRYPDALKNFEAFPKSVKRGILEWIANAKKEETRQKRITETASQAADNMRANQYRPQR